MTKGIRLKFINSILLDLQLSSGIAKVFPNPDTKSATFDGGCCGFGFRVCITPWLIADESVSNTFVLLTLTPPAGAGVGVDEAGVDVADVGVAWKR